MEHRPRELVGTFRAQRLEQRACILYDLGQLGSQVLGKLALRVLQLAERGLEGRYRFAHVAEYTAVR